MNYKLSLTAGGSAILSAERALARYRIEGAKTEVRALWLPVKFELVERAFVELANARWWEWKAGSVVPFARMISRGLQVNGRPIRITLKQHYSSSPWTLTATRFYYDLTLYPNWKAVERSRIAQN